MEGGSLQAALDEDRLAWWTRVRMLHEMALGLLFLHNQQPPVCHCDLKPSNVLLSLREGGRAKLADVGLAKSLPAGRTRASTQSLIAGSFNFICPEYQQTGSMRPACDLYGLGMTMAVAVTNRPAPGLGMTLMEERFNGNLGSTVDTRKGAQGW